MSLDIAMLAEHAWQGRPPTLEQAAALLQPSSWAELSVLMAAAGQVRQQALGDEVEFCAIVNAKSGRCSEDCAFCAQSIHHHTEAQVHPLLSSDEIVAAALAAAGQGACRFGIVTSGRGCPSGRDFLEICRAVERLNQEKRIAPCVSLGLLNQEQARDLANAGARRYHHNLEAGPNFFPRICTTHSYEQRVATVHTARQAGMEVCVGGIVGLGESPGQRAEFIAAVAGLEPDSVPLNFLNPISGTPLQGLPLLTPLQALATVAVTRLFNPRVHVRTCGGRRQVLARLAPLMYLAGASATMTGNYLTTPGQEPAEDAADVAALGLTLAGQVSRGQTT
jgi:biotin synthase